MKTLFYTLAIVLGSTFTSNAVETKTVEQVKPITIEEISPNAFQISSSEMLAPMTISVEKTKEETIYTVEASPMKATYVLNEFGFGLRMKRTVINEMKKKGLTDRFDVTQFHNQSVLSKSAYLSNDKCLNIIANFFPLLVK